MFNDFKPFYSESKDSMVIEIKGEMTSQDTKEVAKITAQGRQYFWKCVGWALIIAVFFIGLAWCIQAWKA